MNKYIKINKIYLYGVFLYWDRYADSLFAYRYFLSKTLALQWRKEVKIKYPKLFIRTSIDLIRSEGARQVVDEHNQIAKRSYGI